MKCWHLVAALGLAACGLNSAPVPQAGRAFDAGASDSATANDMGGRSTIAGSPASWPTRRRLPRLDRDKKDGGSADTKGAGGAGGSGGANTPGSGNSSSPNQGGATSPSGNSGSSPGQPGSSSNPGGGKNSPGNTAGGKDAGSTSGSTKPSNGSHSTFDAGSGSSGHADASSGNGPRGNDDDDDDDKAGEHDSNRPDSDDDHDPGMNGGGPSPSSPVGATVGSIVDLVLAIVDLSLSGSSPAIQQLVSTILVLSLSPVELAADSLTQVLDALDSTHICHDRPEQCDPLCQDLKHECHLCDGDHDCIEHIEETCKVHLPDSCY